MNTGVIYLHQTHDSVVVVIADSSSVFRPL